MLLLIQNQNENVTVDMVFTILVRRIPVLLSQESKSYLKIGLFITIITGVFSQHDMQALKKLMWMSPSNIVLGQNIYNIVDKPDTSLNKLTNKSAI